MSTTPAYLFSRKHATAVFHSAGGVTKTLRPGPGDWQVSGLQAGFVEAVPVMDHGEFLELVEGDAVFPTGSLTVLQGSTDFGVLDAIMQTGSFAAEASVDPGLVVWTGNLVVTLTRGGTTKVFTHYNCRFSANLASAKEGNAYSISYTVYGKSDGTKIEIT